MTEERRREPRIDTISLNLFAHDNLSNELLGTVVNLSRRGIMLLTRARADIGGVLQIDLREANQPDKPMFSMGIKVGWISPAQTPGNFWLGGRIVGIAPEDSDKLHALLVQAHAPAQT